MKKLFYIFALGLTLSMASCAPSEVDDIFDENPAVRIDNAVKNYTELLKSNGGRWNMKYFANGDEGGYNFMMLFKNGSVEISGKNYYTGDAFVQDESMWEVIADYGPVLTFNTYNEVFHLFSDPVPDGTGLGGDYEFIVMKAEENKITLRGKKTGITAVLERVTDNVTDQEFFAEVEANRAASSRHWSTHSTSLPQLATSLPQLVTTMRCGQSSPPPVTVPLTLSTTPRL